MVIRRPKNNSLPLTCALGMFIFATLAMGNLLSQVSRKELRKELKEIPSDLDQVYVSNAFQLYLSVDIKTLA